jgi:hypothetical protein
VLGLPLPQFDAVGRIHSFRPRALTRFAQATGNDVAVTADLLHGTPFTLLLVPRLRLPASRLFQPRLLVISPARSLHRLSAPVIVCPAPRFELCLASGFSLEAQPFFLARLLLSDVLV